MDLNYLELEKEFTDKFAVKHTQISVNRCAYLYENISSNGNVLFEVFNRLKTAKMKYFEKWNFRKESEALEKFKSIKY